MPFSVNVVLKLPLPVFKPLITVSVYTLAAAKVLIFPIDLVLISLVNVVFKAYAYEDWLLQYDH